MKSNYKMTVQYDGTRFDGWQKQGNTGNTIQGKLEQILNKLTGDKVEVTGSGRTDAGVHAIAQIANFKLQADLSVDKLKGYINQYLPEDIRVIKLEVVSERFHSRLSAVSKTYCYQIETAKCKDVFERNYYYGLGESLNVEKMRKAAGYLIGQYDFKSFCSNKRMKKSTIRTIEQIQIKEVGSKVMITFKGNGFLYHMVRILTGTLIEVGLEKRDTQSIKEILESKDRANAGFTAPAEGLFLIHIQYN